MKDLPPFYVGQKVVYIKNKSLPHNSEWIVLDIRTKMCGCDKWVIWVGKMLRNRYAKQGKCGGCGKINKSDGKFWHFASSFAPIESTFQSISFEKVIEKESPLIGVN